MFSVRKIIFISSKKEEADRGRSEGSREDTMGREKVQRLGRWWVKRRAPPLFRYSGEQVAAIKDQLDNKCEHI